MANREKEHEQRIVDAVNRIRAASTDEEARDIEASMLTQTDNSPKPDDPETNDDTRSDTK